MALKGFMGINIVLAKAKCLFYHEGMFKINVKNLFVVTLFFLGCSTSHSVKPNSTPPGADPATMANTNEPDFIKELKGPPNQGSKEDAVDYHTLLKLQKHRTKAECARAETEVKISLGSLFGGPYGPLSAAEVTQWSDYFYTVGMEADQYVHMAKKDFQRPRPYVTHSDLHPCIPKESSFSYPSGHSALSRFYMHMLGDIYPQLHVELEKRADQIAFDRNLGGVHYPSDIRDGKFLGDKIYEYMVKNAGLKERTHVKMSEFGGVGKELPPESAQ
jgi:acid phosphatase (class A)